jgi:DNA-damage-inducible protein J
MNRVQTSLRLDADKFLEAKEILKNLGLNFTDAVNIFTSLVVANKGLPFEVKMPSKKLQKSMDELENRDGKSFKNLDELFEDLDS